MQAKAIPQWMAQAIADYRGEIRVLRPSLAPVCVPVPPERKGFDISALATLARQRLLSQTG